MTAWMAFFVGVAVGALFILGAAALSAGRDMEDTHQ